VPELLNHHADFVLDLAILLNSKGVSLRTNNRNFLGRSGTKDAMVYTLPALLLLLFLLLKE